MPFSVVAGAAWLACAAQAVFGIPEGLTLCPVKLATGYSCPGCGMGHAVVHAMRGDLAASWSYHPLGIPLLAIWTGWLAFKLVENARMRYNMRTIAGW